MRPRSRSLVLLPVAAILLTVACERSTTGLAPATFPTDAVVFTDNFAAGLGFMAFGGSKLDALSIDQTVKRTGTASLKFTIPAPGDPSGGYAGGAFVAGVGRDLSGYNALTFWVRSSIPASLNTVGFGNDNTGTSQYTVERSAVPVTPAWTKVVIPIPLASKLTRERGLLYLAEGPENNAGYDLWIDDVKFENLPTISNIRPAFASATISQETGSAQPLGGTTVTSAVGGVDVTVSASPNYFTFLSSNAAVATIAGASASVIGTGTTNITARLGTTLAAGTVVLNASTPPSVAAPTPPVRVAGDVISLYSDAYANVPVDTWSASWDQADVSDVTLAGNATKRYANLVYAGIEMTSAQKNATAMTHVHLDVYVTNNATFKVKIVDFGKNGVFNGGGDDKEHQLTFTPTSTPALVAGGWTSIDLPLSAFAGLTTRGNIAQIVVEGTSPTTYLDNVYFYRVPVPTSPPAPAVAPTAPAGQVISLFSNAYTNVPVDTWSAVWDGADVADVQVAGNDIKKYTNFNFAGIEFGSAPIDATAMTTFNFDLWTPDATAMPAVFKVKLVDFGANGSFGGGDDVEHELTFNATTVPALATGSWVRFAIPLSAFTGLTTRAHLAQLILVSDPKTVFLDNVYFSSATAPTAPLTAAPTPTYPAGNVISLYSNAYTNVTVDTWSAIWDQADVADVLVAGNDAKKYTNLIFAGIEFTGNPINATTMTHFRFDVWTADPTAAPAFFKAKLVDFGGNGTFGGGDDVEHELTFTASSVPALTTGSWVTYDIPLALFSGLVTKGHLAQLIFVSDPKTVFIDNVLLHK